MSSQKQNAGMKTLNLRLDEVAHIRSVLTKAELEALPIDGNVRHDVERGKVSRKKIRTSTRIEQLRRRKKGCNLI